MSTIIWCDHIRHIVQESRTDVERIIESVQQYLAADWPEETSFSSDIETARWPSARGFAFFTPDSADSASGRQQRALNVTLISSFEAMPGDGI